MRKLVLKKLDEIKKQQNGFKRKIWSTLYFVDNGEIHISKYNYHEATDHNLFLFYNWMMELHNKYQKSLYSVLF